MSRNLKALGLALIATLALSGVMAVGAQAETAVESELKAPAVTKLDVANDKNKHGELGRLTIGNGARFVECTTIGFDGTITGSATTVKGTVNFSNCFANNIPTSPATVTHNSCTLSVTPLKTSSATATASCPEKTPQEVQIHIFENAAAHTANKPLCTYDITLPGVGQTVTGGTITTGGEAGSSHDLKVGLAGTSKLKEIYNTGPGGLAVCGVAVNKHAEGAFSGSLTVSGTNSESKPAGITLV